MCDTNGKEEKFIFFQRSPKKEITGSTRNRRTNMKSIPKKVIRVSVGWMHLVQEEGFSECCEKEDKILDSNI